MQELFVTFGVFTGVGIGLTTTPGVILTARYFDKRRGVANAFCFSGPAAGSFILPFLIEHLLEVYGFRGTMLILGACMLHILISSALFRPLAIHVKIVRRDRLHQQYLQSNKCIGSHDDDIKYIQHGRVQSSNNQESSLQFHPFPSSWYALLNKSFSQYKKIIICSDSDSC